MTPKPSLRRSLRADLWIETPTGRAYRCAPLDEAGLSELGAVGLVLGQALRLAYLAATVRGLPEAQREQLREQAEAQGVAVDQTETSARSTARALYSRIACRQIRGVRLPPHLRPDGAAEPWEGALRVVPGMGPPDQDAVIGADELPQMELEAVAVALLLPHLEVGRRAGTFRVARA